MITMTNVYKKENMARLQEILGDVGDNSVRAIEKIIKLPHGGEVKEHAHLNDEIFICLDGKEV